MWLGKEGEGMIYMLDAGGAGMLVCAYLSVLVCSGMSGICWKDVVCQTEWEVSWYGHEELSKVWYYVLSTSIEH